MSKKVTGLIAKGAKLFANLWLYAGVFVFFCTFNAYPKNPTDESDSLIAFFKQAISTPPDVEGYSIGEYGFDQKVLARFAGARAGSNYFIHVFSDTNGSNASAVPGTLFIAGRSGTNEYECGQNNISYVYGPNGMTDFVGAYFNVTRQLLDLGLGDIEPGSVKWDGYTFTATNARGGFDYGELRVSNGIPSRLEVSAAKGSPPYKVVEYTYPDPSSSLSGFPAKMLIFGETGGALKPRVEVRLYSVQLAAKPLSEKFFSAAQFITSNIIYTNIYSNTDVYAQARHGQTATMMKLPNSLLKSGGYSNSRPRIVIFLCFALITIIPIACFIFITIQKKQKAKLLI